MKSTTRSYRMQRRGAAVERTRQRILSAAYALWLKLDYDALSLEQVAARAKVSKQTVIRQFGSKDRLAFATADWLRTREEAARTVEPGDLGEAVSVLLGRYERMGDANVRVLAIEHRVPAIRYMLQGSRQSHRSWVERVFAPYLPRDRGAAYRRKVTAFYLATEVMNWKLLRRDLQLSRGQTEGVFLELLTALAHAAPADVAPRGAP
ncbi:MAG: TetR/AcrR family transcriptional regulator [Archangiaceae bacterium]|nr:TetR/AcrR family transcriptional regulator [Archangiaceae bacterium]